MHSKGPFVVSSSVLVCQQDTGAVLANCVPTGVAEIDPTFQAAIGNAALFALAPRMIKALMDICAMHAMQDNLYQDRIGAMQQARDLLREYMVSQSSV